MRHRACIVSLTIAAGMACIGELSLVANQAGRQRVNVPTSLVAARRAIGIQDARGAVKSLVLIGSAMSKTGASVVGAPPRPHLTTSVEVEIRMLLPNDYVRIEKDADFISRYGVSGDTLIRDWKGLVPAAQKINMRGSPGQIETERFVFARLALGLLAETRTLLSLRESPRKSARTAGSTELVGDNGFEVTVDLDGQTRVPTAVRYEGEVVFRRPDTESVRDGVRRFTANVDRVLCEVTLSFEDRRPVAGVNIPHRITTTARGVVVEEITFDRVVVNPPLTAKDFERPPDFQR